MDTRPLWSDDGFTLTELIVVVGLLGVVLAAAYGLLNVASGSAKQSNREAWIADEIGAPLDAAERAFTQQAPPMVTTERNICEIRTDQDRDNHYEFHRYEATSDGRFIETYYEEVDRPTAVVRTWSDSNDNIAAGVPAFTYFDIDGKDISDTPEDLGGVAFIQRYTVSVEVSLAAKYDGAQFTDSRRIFFRNR